jgi:hypothetical protein
MEDLKTLLIATTFLAIGGLGLYMYKSDELDFDIDDNISDIDSDTSSHTSEASSLFEEDIDDYKEKPKSRKNEGTKRNTKKNGGTRKKY